MRKRCGRHNVNAHLVEPAERLEDPDPVRLGLRSVERRGVLPEPLETHRELGALSHDVEATQCEAAVRQRGRQRGHDVDAEAAEAALVEARERGLLACSGWWLMSGEW